MKNQEINQWSWSIFIGGRDYQGLVIAYAFNQCVA